MKYLVTGKWVEVGALLPPQQLEQILETAVVPSLEMFAAWEAEGRIHGGVLVGERAGAFILEADSPEEAGATLAGLPFWGMLQWDVKPLQSFTSTVEREKGVRKQVRAALGG